MDGSCVTQDADPSVRMERLERLDNYRARVGAADRARRRGMRVTIDGLQSLATEGRLSGNESPSMVDSSSSQLAHSRYRELSEGNINWEDSYSLTNETGRRQTTPGGATSGLSAVGEESIPGWPVVPLWGPNLLGSFLRYRYLPANGVQSVPVSSLSGNYQSVNRNGSTNDASAHSSGPVDLASGCRVLPGEPPRSSFSTRGRPPVFPPSVGEYRELPSGIDSSAVRQRGRTLDETDHDFSESERRETIDDQEVVYIQNGCTPCRRRRLNNRIDADRNDRVIERVHAQIANNANRHISSNYINSSRGVLPVPSMPPRTLDRGDDQHILHRNVAFRTMVTASPVQQTFSPNQVAQEHSVSTSGFADCGQWGDAAVTRSTESGGANQSSCDSDVSMQVDWQIAFSSSPNRRT